MWSYIEDETDSHKPDERFLRARKPNNSYPKRKGRFPNILQTCPECNWFPSKIGRKSCNEDPWAASPLLPSRSPQDSFSYNTSISACCNRIAWTEALQCFSSMSWLIHPDLVAYNAASHATGVAKSWQHSLQLLRCNYLVCILYFLLMSCTPIPKSSIFNHLAIGVVSDTCGGEVFWDKHKLELITERKRQNH